MKYLLLILFTLALPLVAFCDTGTLTASAAPVFAPGATTTHGYYDLITLTHDYAGDATLQASATGAVSGKRTTLKITSSGTTQYVLTFGSGFTSQGTLVLGTTSGVVWMVEFVYDGTYFRECSRIRQAPALVVVPITATTCTLPYSEGAQYTFTPTTSTINLAIDKAGRIGAVINLRIIYDSSTACTTTFTTNIKTAQPFINTGFSDTEATALYGTTSYTSCYVTFVSDGTNWRIASGTELMAN